MINIISDILLCENRTPKIAFMDWFEINSEQVKMALLTQIQSGQPVEFITPCVVTGYEDTIFGTAELNMVQLATALRARGIDVMECKLIIKKQNGHNYLCIYVAVSPGTITLENWWLQNKEDQFLKISEYAQQNRPGGTIKIHTPIHISEMDNSTINNTMIKIQNEVQVYLGEKFSTAQVSSIYLEPNEQQKTITLFIVYTISN